MMNSNYRLPKISRHSQLPHPAYLRDPNMQKQRMFLINIAQFAKTIKNPVSNPLTMEVYGERHWTDLM